MTERTPEQEDFEDEMHEEIDQAIEACQIRWVRGKVRVFEPGTTQKGKPKRDVSLSFPDHDGTWHTVYHSIIGDNLDHVQAILTHCDDRWTTVGVGEIETSSSPSKKPGEEGKLRAYHRTMNMVFLLPMNYVFDSHSNPDESEQDEENGDGDDWESRPF